MPTTKKPSTVTDRLAPKKTSPAIELPSAVTKRPEPNTRVLRRPEPKRTWPITLLVGHELVGKSYQSALASADSRVDNTIWISWGEKDPSWLAEIPGADFNLVDHDGTAKDMIAAVNELKADQPDNETWLLVIDSATEFWKTIRGEATQTAIDRDYREESGMLITGRDLYYEGDSQWAALINAIRTWRGPVILTGRPDEGPTRLRYDVDALVELTQPGEAVIRGARTLHPIPTNEPIPGFTIRALWTLMKGDDK